MHSISRCCIAAPGARWHALLAVLWLNGRLLRARWPVLSLDFAWLWKRLCAVIGAPDPLNIVLWCGLVQAAHLRLASPRLLQSLRPVKLLFQRRESA